MLDVRHLPIKDSRCLRNVVNCLKLDVNTVGYQLSGLQFKRPCRKPEFLSQAFA